MGFFNIHDGSHICFLVSLMTQPNVITQSNVVTQSMLHSVTLHLRKKSPFKENIHVTKSMTFSDLINFIFPIGQIKLIRSEKVMLFVTWIFMTFSDLINFIFPIGPPEDKRFIFKSSFEAGGKQFLPEQIM